MSPSKHIFPQGTVNVMPVKPRPSRLLKRVALAAETAEGPCTLNSDHQVLDSYLTIN